MDGLNVGATLQAGALTRVIGYQTSNAPSEEIDVGATLQAAALTVVIRYQTYNAAPDSVDVSAALKAGSLIRVIGYVDTSANEALDVSATIVGGTLS
jgi:hypothetical protein